MILPICYWRLSPILLIIPIAIRFTESVRYHYQDQITDACFNCDLPNELEKFEVSYV